MRVCVHQDSNLESLLRRQMSLPIRLCTPTKAFGLAGDLRIELSRQPVLETSPRTLRVTQYVSGQGVSVARGAVCVSRRRGSIPKVAAPARCSEARFRVSTGGRGRTYADAESKSAALPLSYSGNRSDKG